MDVRFEDIVFSTVAQAEKARKALRRRSILASRNKRELRVWVPTKVEPECVRKLAISLSNG